MSSYHSAFFRPVRSRFFTIARSVSEKFHGKFAFVEYFARVHIDERGFGRRKHKLRAFFVTVFAVYPINFIGEFRELPRAETAIISEHVRRQNHFVTVFEVSRDEVVEKRPFEPCAVAAIEPIAVARKFNAPFVVDYSERSAKVHVVFSLKRKFGFFAEHFYNLIVFLFAGEKVVVGHIRQRSDVVGNAFLQIVYFSVALGDFFADFAHTRENFFYGLAFFFKFGYFSRNFVSLRFEGFYFSHQFLSFGVEFKNLGKVCHATFFSESCLYEFGIFGYKFQIEHNYLLSSCGNANLRPNYTP